MGGCGNGAAESCCALGMTKACYPLLYLFFPLSRKKNTAWSFHSFIQGLHVKSWWAFLPAGIKVLSIVSPLYPLLWSGPTCLEIPVKSPCTLR